MTTASTPVNYSLLKLYIDVIPNFNSDPHTLEVFLEHCDYLIKTYKNSANPDHPLNVFLTRAIIGKLTGNALMLVGSRPEIRDWIELKNLLRLSFGDNRNLDCLVQEMMVMTPFKNESFLALGQRIQKARSSSASKLISMNLDVAERNFLIKNYDGLSLKTFIRGLSGRIQDMVRLRIPDNLELAISYVLEEENLMLNQKQISFFHTPKIQANFRPQSQQSYMSKNYASPNYSATNNLFSTRQNFIPQQRQSFPSQPINIQPRQNLPPQKFFTNQQVFGTPRNANNTNVFKPTGNIPQNMPQSMSISNRNTSVQRPNTNYNHFRPNYQTKNFISEELHNIEYSETQPENCNDQNDLPETPYDPECFDTQYENHESYTEQSQEYLYDQKKNIIDLNHLQNNLPYIIIPEINARFLIDTGSSRSLINPNLAYTFYQNFISKENFNIQTSHDITFHDEVATIAIFYIFETNETHKFYLFD